MNWQDKPVLVTGAGGFIGSHLVEGLVGLGARARALVRYNSAGARGWLDHSPCQDRIEVVAGDVGDRDGVRRAMEGVQVVFHLAALIGIPYSYHAPASYVRTNMEGTLNVLQAARELGLERVVHTSTSEVYGTAQYAPIDEAHPLQGQSPYSATKIGADKLAEAFHLSFGLPVVTVRPFNTYGPRQSARAVIPAIITQALRGPVVRLGSLEPTRDFNYVADTVRGFVRAAECPEAIGQTINLGSGQEVSVGELVGLIGDILGREVRTVCEDQRLRPGPSEVQRLLADNRKARTVLGWGPRYTLKEGLAETVEWMEKNLERYHAGTYAV